MEALLRRDIPIVTTPHAKTQLSSLEGDDCFTNVHQLDTFASLFIRINRTKSASLLREQTPAMRVTAMPGKHVPPGVETLNEIVQAVQCPSDLRQMKRCSHVLDSTGQRLDA